MRIPRVVRHEETEDDSRDFALSEATDALYAILRWFVEDGYRADGLTDLCLNAIDDVTDDQ